MKYNLKIKKRIEKYLSDKKVVIEKPSTSERGIAAKTFEEAMRRRHKTKSIFITAEYVKDKKGKLEYLLIMIYGKEYSLVFTTSTATGNEQVRIFEEMRISIERSIVREYLKKYK